MAKMAKKAVPQYKFATGFFALRAMASNPLRAPLVVAAEVPPPPTMRLPWPCPLP